MFQFPQPAAGVRGIRRVVTTAAAAIHRGRLPAAAGAAAGASGRDQRYLRREGRRPQLKLQPENPKLKLQPEGVSLLDRWNGTALQVKPRENFQ